MATQADVRRIALALPDVVESTDDFAFAVVDKSIAKATRAKAKKPAKPKKIAWVWKERVHPKKARVPNAAVLAVRVADEVEKQMLLDGDPAVYFTEPHYDGFPAVLVRLAAIRAPELSRILAAAWRCMAPKHLAVDTPPRRVKAHARS